MSRVEGGKERQEREELEDRREGREGEQEGEEKGTGRHDRWRWRYKGVIR